MTIFPPSPQPNAKGDDEHQGHNEAGSVVPYGGEVQTDPLVNDSYSVRKRFVCQEQMNHLPAADEAFAQGKRLGCPAPVGDSMTAVTAYCEKTLA